MSVRSYRSSDQQPRYVQPFTFTTVADAWGAGGASGAGFEEFVEFNKISESDGVAAVTIVGGPKGAVLGGRFKACRAKTVLVVKMRTLKVRALAYFIMISIGARF